MPLGSVFQAGGLAQQKQASPFPRKFNMCPPWAWHHWKDWEKERLHLSLGCLLHAQASSVVTLLAFFNRGVGPLGSWCPERGESSAWLLMQWVTPWALRSCELQCHPRITPLHGCHPGLPSVWWDCSGHICGLSHPQLQDEPCKLLFGCWEERDSAETGSSGGPAGTVCSKLLGCPSEHSMAPLASCVACSSLVHVHHGEEWHTRKFPASWLQR